MHREYVKWWSPALGRDMEMLVFGHGGQPVLAFPTSMGRFFEFEDRGMIAALAYPLESGRLQIFCVDSVDPESWYNRKIPPPERVLRHMQYEQYLTEDVLPFIRHRNEAGRIAVTGCSFGGYHALNFALKHPEMVNHCLTMSGAFDVHQFLGGHGGENAYYNNPVQYLPGLTDQNILDEYCQNVRFDLAAGERDICLDDNLRMSRIMELKGIPHRLDIWGNHAGHDWVWWQQMARKFLC